VRDTGSESAGGPRSGAVEGRPTGARQWTANNPCGGQRRSRLGETLRALWRSSIVIPAHQSSVGVWLCGVPGEKKAKPSYPNMQRPRIRTSTTSARTFHECRLRTSTGQRASDRRHGVLAGRTESQPSSCMRVRERQSEFRHGCVAGSCELQTPTSFMRFSCGSDDASDSVSCCCFGTRDGEREGSSAPGPRTTLA